MAQWLIEPFKEVEIRRIKGLREEMVTKCWIIDHIVMIWIKLAGHMINMIYK